MLGCSPRLRQCGLEATLTLYALAHNLMRMAKIAPQLIGWGTGAPATALVAA